MLSAHHALADFVEESKWQLADQEEYQKQFDELETVLNQAKDAFEKAEHVIQDRSVRKHLIDQFMHAIAGQVSTLENFDESLWIVTVDEVLVKRSGELVIKLKNGQHMKMCVQ